MEEGDEDFVFYGTAIEEEESTRPGQYRKDAKDPASTRALPIHKQEVTDEQGRRRFHGAFTGGFSAGYYNTVGSAEGWVPSSFRSSRSARAEGQKQTVEDFLDEDELEELRRTNLQTTEQYDTFGSTAAELARRAAVDEQQSRPSAIPGLLPEELVAPVADSVGVRLLQRMGWRQGKGVGMASGGAAEDEEGGPEGAGTNGGGGGGAPKSRWGQHAGVGAENTQLYLLKPKTDLFGVGFDPFKGAEEFRKARQERLGAGPGRQQPQPGAKRQRGVAFGTGVLDEDDAFGIMEDYVTHDDIDSYEETVDDSGLPRSRGPKVARKGLGDRLQRRGYTFEIQDEEDEGEDEGPHHKGSHSQQYLLPSSAEPHLALQGKEHLVRPGGFIPGFVRASSPPAPLAFFPPPRIPPGYVPLRFGPPQQPQQQGALGVGPPPPEAPPPADPALKQEIDSLAFYVAKNGVVFENMARQRAQREGAGGRQAFLLGGEGSAYYQWKVHAFKSMIQPQSSIGQRSAPLSYEERGAMLGERSLPAQPPQAQQAQHQGAGAASQSLARNLLAVAEADRQRIQAMLGRSFVKAAEDPQDAQQAQQASVGGLRQPAPAPAAPPAPLPVVEDRAATAGPGAPLPGLGAHRVGASKIITAADLSRPGAGREVAAPGAAGAGAGAGTGAGAGAGAPRLPVRFSEEWRPSPLLCKRLNVPDPYQGKPAEVQMSRFKTDHLALPDTAASLATAAAAAGLPPVPPGTEQLLLPPSAQQAFEAAKQQVQALAAQAQAQLASQQAQQAEAPADAAGLADSFLSSLAADLMGGVGGDMGGGPSATAAAAAPWATSAGLQPLQQQQQQQPPLPPGEEALAAAAAAAVSERPIDLFKAIFEDSDEEEEEEQEAEAAKPLAPPQQQQQQQQAQPGLAEQGTAAQHAAASAAGPGGGPPPPPWQQQPAHGQPGPSREASRDEAVFGFAKLRREGAPVAAAAYEGQTGRQGGLAGGGTGAAPAGGAGGAAIDADTKRRVEEALRALRKHGKEKKEKRGRGERGKEKKRKREKSKKDKGKKGKKSRHKKKSSRDGKEHKRGRRGREGAESSGGDSDSGSGSSSSDGSESG